MPLPKPCTWNGIIYQSISAAARACGITPNSMCHRLAMGYTCDADVPNRRLPLEFTWECIRFPNASQAAKAFGHHPATMQYRKRHGWTCEADVPKNGFVSSPQNISIDLHDVRASMRRGVTLEIIADLNGITRLEIIEAFRNEDKHEK